MIRVLEESHLPHGGEPASAPSPAVDRVVVAHVAASERLPLATGAEHAVYVALGACAARARGAATDLSRGDALHAPADAAVTLTAGDGGAALVVASAVAAPAPGERGAFTRVRSADVPMTPSGAGMRGVETRWLVHAERGGARRLVVGLSELAPGGAHELHRHPHAAQAMVALTDGLVALGQHADGPLPPLEPLIVPAGRPHGVHNGAATPGRCLVAYLGVGSPAAAGIEQLPPPPPRADAQSTNERRRAGGADHPGGDL